MMPPNGAGPRMQMPPGAPPCYLPCPACPAARASPLPCSAVPHRATGRRFVFPAPLGPHEAAAPPRVVAQQAPMIEHIWLAA